MDLLRLEFWKEQDEEMAGAASREDRSGETASLVERAARLVRAGSLSSSSGQGGTGGQTPIRCADGYLRRTPVQFYRISSDYRKRVRRRTILAALAGVFLLILATLLLLSLTRGG